MKKSFFLISLLITSIQVTFAQQIESKSAEFHCPPPMYPSASVRLWEEGTVVVLVTIKSDNSLGPVILESSSGFRRLDKVILELMQHCSLNAALHNGMRVDSVVRRRFDFRMPEEKPKK